jgi:hypothetical protein
LLDEVEDPHELAEGFPFLGVEVAFLSAGARLREVAAAEGRERKIHFWAF